MKKGLGKAARKPGSNICETLILHRGNFSIIREKANTIDGLAILPVKFERAFYSAFLWQTSSDVGIVIAQAKSRKIRFKIMNHTTYTQGRTIFKIQFHPDKVGINVRLRVWIMSTG